MSRRNKKGGGPRRNSATVSKPSEVNQPISHGFDSARTVEQVDGVPSEGQKELLKTLLQARAGNAEKLQMTRDLSTAGKDCLTDAVLTQQQQKPVKKNGRPQQHKGDSETILPRTSRAAPVVATTGATHPQFLGVEGGGATKIKRRNLGGGNAFGTSTAAVTGASTKVDASNQQLTIEVPRTTLESMLKGTTITLSQSALDNMMSGNVSKITLPDLPGTVGKHAADGLENVAAALAINGNTNALSPNLSSLYAPQPIASVVGTNMTLANETIKQSAVEKASFAANGPSALAHQYYQHNLLSNNILSPANHLQNANSVGSTLHQHHPNGSETDSLCDDGDNDIPTQHMYDQMVLNLYSGVPENEIDAIVRFRKVLSKEPNPPIDDVIRIGVLPKLVQFLQRNDFPAVQFEAAWALTNIASGTSDQTRRVVEAGAVPIFVDLLCSSCEDVQEQAVWALGNIAGDSPALRNLVLDAGVLDSLLPIFTSANTRRVGMVRNAVWCLSNLCRGKHPLPDFSKVVKTQPVLGRLLFHNDCDVLADACWAISYLSDGPNERIQAVIDSGVTRRLVELLSCESQLVVSAALRAVGNLVTGDDAQTQVVLDCGVLEPLKNILRKPLFREAVKKEACWTISNITAGNKQQIQLVNAPFFDVAENAAQVIDADLIPVLISVLRVVDFKTKREACWALTNALSGSSGDQVQSVISCGIIEPMSNLLAVNDSRTLLVALTGVEVLLRLGALAASAATQAFNDNDRCSTNVAAQSSTPASSKRPNAASGSPLDAGNADENGFAASSATRFEASGFTSGAAVVPSTTLGYTTSLVNTYAEEFKKFHGVERLEMLLRHDNKEIYQKAMMLIEHYFGVGGGGGGANVLGLASGVDTSATGSGSSTRNNSSRRSHRRVAAIRVRRRALAAESRKTLSKSFDDEDDEEEVEYEIASKTTTFSSDAANTYGDRESDGTDLDTTDDEDEDDDEEEEEDDDEDLSFPSDEEEDDDDDDAEEYEYDDESKSKLVRSTPDAAAINSGSSSMPASAYTTPSKADGNNNSRFLQSMTVSSSSTASKNSPSSGEKRNLFFGAASTPTKNLANNMHQQQSASTTVNGSQQQVSRFGSGINANQIISSPTKTHQLSQESFFGTVPSSSSGSASLNEMTKLANSSATKLKDILLGNKQQPSSSGAAATKNQQSSVKTSPSQRIETPFFQALSAAGVSPGTARAVDKGGGSAVAEASAKQTTVAEKKKNKMTKSGSVEGGGMGGKAPGFSFGTVQPTQAKFVNAADSGKKVSGDAVKNNNNKSLNGNVQVSAATVNKENAKPASFSAVMEVVVNGNVPNEKVGNNVVSEDKKSTSKGVPIAAVSVAGSRKGRSKKIHHQRAS